MPKKTRQKTKASPKRKTTRYHAQVARFIIETAYITPDAADSDQAERRMLKMAKVLPDNAWGAATFDEAPHIKAIVGEDELEDPSDDPHEEFALVTQEYALLRGDTFNGEGDVILQPWLVIDRPNLLTSDIVGDWLAKLEKLGVHEMSERMDEIRTGAPVTAEDRAMIEQSRRGKKDKPKPNNVVPFRRSKTDPDGDDGPDAA